MTKRNFKAPTELFLSTEASHPTEPITGADVPAGYAVKLIRESKSERFQILIRPSVKAELERIAIKQGTSRNDLINQIIEDYIKGEQA